MPTSGPQQARRAFIKLILVLAVSYTLEVGLHQSSLDSQVTAAFRKIVKRVHPDNVILTCDCELGGGLKAVSGALRRYKSFSVFWACSF